MGKFEKAVSRLKSKPRNFTYEELRRVLNGLGYKEKTGGKTSGSRVAFVQAETGHIIRLHKPHPGNILKAYQVELVLEELSNKDLI